MNFSFLLSVAHAAPVSVPVLRPTGEPPTTENTGSLTDSISSVASNVIEVLLVIGGALAVLYLIYAGIQYITSGGVPDRAKSARAGIINAVIGVVVIVAAFFIVRFASSLGKTASCLDQKNCTTTVTAKPTTKGR